MSLDELLLMLVIAGVGAFALLAGRVIGKLEAKEEADRVDAESAAYRAQVRKASERDMVA